ncbi:(2Fe-2S)-binding protein [Lentibacillus halodurans]|nr:(2Fe-2S)-binding protein [Lentibacillus halodurans]
MGTDTVICRCEEVMRSEVVRELEHGAVTSKALKLKTRVGMGVCQGRICRPLLEQVISFYTGGTRLPSPDLKSHHPVRPLSVIELAETGKDL